MLFWVAAGMDEDRRGRLERVLGECVQRQAALQPRDWLPARRRPVRPPLQLFFFQLVHEYPATSSC